MVQHQAQVQGKSVVQYLRELQARQSARRGGARYPTTGCPPAPREKYVYLTRREVDLLFDQITDLRDRALFGAMYYFGLRSFGGRIVASGVCELSYSSHLHFHG